MVLGYAAAVNEMHKVADEFPATADLMQAIVPDFHSVRQALNVASADQRVLVVINAANKQLTRLRTSLREVSNHLKITGRFHFDFEDGNHWKNNVTGTSSATGIVVIRPGEFGMTGSVMQQLPLDCDAGQIRTTLLAANSEFARTTERKVYSDHVSKGEGLGIYFEGTLPYGEDRDGDGQIDSRPHRHRGLSGRQQSQATVRSR